MNIPFEAVKKNVVAALDEDIGSGDCTSALLPPVRLIQAEILSREPMFVCGIPWVEAVFTHIDPTINCQWLVSEGDWLDKPQSLCLLKGQARSILTAERTALNFLQTLAATATQTYYFIQALKGTKTKLLDTRKTLPGLRLAQKYAVALAGGVNHRLGLYDAFLIKENHIKACGSIKEAVARARILAHDRFLEVEVETLAELEEALNAKPERILLDNFSLPMIETAVIMAKPYSCPLEVSGGVTLDNIRTIAERGVDFISVGSITKSIAAIDLSLLIKEV